MNVFLITWFSLPSTACPALHCDVANRVDTLSAMLMLVGPATLLHFCAPALPYNTVQDAFTEMNGLVAYVLTVLHLLLCCFFVGVLNIHSRFCMACCLQCCCSCALLRRVFPRMHPASARCCPRCRAALWRCSVILLRS